MNQELVSPIKILSALAHIQRWEILNSNLLRSSSGRQLYFGLIRHLNDTNDGLSIDSMKEIYYDDGIRLTERGVRLTIRAFEADGVLMLEKAKGDGRSRRMFLTNKLLEQMQEHAEVARTAFKEDFLVIAK